ncbi:uncharacterized protein BDR25DRAFT_251692 [Lindgomyces ingoldianus]|uniref:Uncharacterized protein n=1 Tax=Lindgomyces ingoldianus TaxID=673940 RepID=A0ACB6RF45_9PLEO|nr:uncharacterized protein BDR25DRAFT_251692 [Lindgomyces ingoldianus]KAF2477117.1 hypothetical protein BDR25DRAFT_251692 [Lindgomyces ingoldianus]
MTSIGGMGSQAIDINTRYINALRTQSKRPRDVRPDLAHSEWSVEYTQTPPSPRPTTVSPQYSQTHSVKPPKPTRQPGLLELQRYDPRYPGLLLQPDSRPISQEQLASEVKSIYAGLTMVETKCVHVDRAQVQAAADSNESKLGPDHWQALIALHRTLLHEHHDFFLASQHPSASPALRRLATKYSMPARMWKHGIHSFLELLRRRLPESIDYMLAFIYLAYQMMALLYETVPAFEDTWIECLGDLGRYRMAVEDEDLRDRETWAGARSWYSKAADKNPTVGRLYHHLAILARPNALQQLYYYARSLTCVKPFPSARESIFTLLDPILGRQTAASNAHALPIDTSFIQAYGVLFKKLTPEKFGDAMVQFQSQLDSHIGRVTAKWKEQGVYIAVTNISGLFDYGANNSILRLLLERHSVSQQRGLPKEHSHRPPPASDFDFRLSKALTLTMSTLSMVLRRIGEKHVLPHVHVLLAFMSSFTSPIINLSKCFSVCPSIITLMSGLSMLPTATALPLLAHQAPPAEEKRTTYSDDSIGDWIISSAVLVYLVIAYWLDPKTRKLSLAGSVISATFWVAMVSEGDRPEFPSKYRWK